MKIMVKVLGAVALVWIVASIIMSVAVSCDPNTRWDIIENRHGLLIVDVGVYEIIVKCGIPSNYWAQWYEGYNATRDEFIWFDRTHEIGEKVLTINVFNPFTNWDDDVIARWDIILW